MENGGENVKSNDVVLAEHEQKIINIIDRISKLESNEESNKKIIHDLELIVNNLVTKMDNVLVSIDKLLTKFENLEAKPADRQEKIIMCAITALVTGIVTACLSIILK